MKFLGSARRTSQAQAAKWLRGLTALLIAFSLVHSAETSNAQAAGPVLFEPGSYTPGQVVVKFRNPAAIERANNKGLQPERLMSDALVQPYNLGSFRELYGMPGYVQYYADKQADLNKLVAALSLNSEVEYAEPVYPVTMRRSANDPLYKSTDSSGNLQFRQWYLERIGIEALWDVTIGNNQVVAVLDTGINPFHEDLVGKVILDRAYDTTRGTFQAKSQIWDDEGHGTAVAGIIAANTNNRLGIAGINWNSLLLPVKVLDETGSGSTVTVAQGITYAADNQARIINMSLGGDKPSKVLEDAVKYAQGKGVLLVASAGNNPDARPDYPASYDNVISVGASNRADTGISNVSKAVSVVAPGVDIFTTYCFFLGNTTNPTQAPGQTSPNTFGSQKCTNPNPSRYPGAPVTCNNNDPNSCYLSTNNQGLYLYIDGTSFAAPIVSGLASLIVAARPDLNNLAIKGLIEGTAVDVDVPGFDTRTGYGRVNAAAIAQALQEGNLAPGRGSILQGLVTGANPADVIVSLDAPNLIQNLNPAGGFRFDNVPAGVYNLRVAVPKRGIVLGPVRVYPNGREGNVLSVNFNIASGSIICGEGTVCPGNQNNAPGQAPVVAAPVPSGLAPNAAFFAVAGPLPGALFFPETSHNLSGSFRGYWERNGGLAIFGFPLSEEFTEVSATDGKTYTVQYFQRNRFEFHPENNEANRVLLGLLGNELTVGRNFPPGAPVPNTNVTMYFPETGHSLSDRFMDYWKRNGGLAIFGYPICEPLQEGPYLVQYFERNRFEFHPENAGTRYEILLGLLGTDLARSRNYLR